MNRPTLVMAHNKTLAAQLFQEFRRFFPDNAVEYFVSYYDYYQPEAYVPASDTYIEKESTINDEIDRMRLSATRSLFERRDVIIVASVSCIYGLGSPEAYYGMVLPLESGQRIDRDQILRKLVEIQYERNDHEFGRGTFRVRGDIIEVYPSYEEIGAAHRPVRRRGRRADVVRSAHRQGAAPARAHRGLSEVALRHAARAAQGGGRDDQGRARPSGAASSKREGKLLEAQRLHQRTMFDLEMIKRDRLLPRHRELLAAPDRPPRRASRRRRCSTTCPPTRWSSSTRATRPCRRSAGCITATARARKCWSSTASACRRRSTTAR